MKKLSLVSGLVTIAFMLGCGGGGSSSGSGGNGGGGGGQAVAISISPSGTVNVAVTFTQQFNATVTGSSNTAVTWSVSGSGCSGTACGTISTSGLYTAPSSIPNPQTVSVTATSMADTSKSATATVKIVGLTLAVVPATATVALNGTQQFSAQVNPSSPVTWSVSGAGCSGVTCGTVDSKGNYTAPGALPSPATITVTATSSVQSTLSAKATVTLIASPDARFQGQFAFRFSGFDNTGHPVYAAGIFSGDGTGNITAGSETVNRSSGVSTVTLTGTYSIGTDNRGSMTITDSNSVTSVYQFAVGSAAEAVFVEADSSGTGGGVIDTADTSAFSAAALKGTYVMNLFGNDTASKRIGAAGMFITDGVSNLTGGTIDLNDAGSPQSNLALMTTGSTYTVAPTGGGTLTANFQTLGTVHYAFYIVSARELFIVSTDAPGASNQVIGVAFSQDQTIQYSNSSLNSATVFNMDGLQSNGSVVAVGEITPANGPLTGLFDENNAGSITASAALSGSYSISTNGRGTMTFTGSSPAPSFVLYMITLNAGLMLDMSSTNVLSGNLEPQSTGAGGVFSAATLQGTFIEGTSTTADVNAVNLSGVLQIDGVSKLNGTEDESTSSGNSLGQVVSGTYTVASTGRGTVTLSSPSAQNLVFYIVSNGRFLGIDVDATNTDAAVIAAVR